MTKEQIEFVQKFTECSVTYWNHRVGKDSHGHTLAERILRRAKLYYEDGDEEDVKRNPIVIAMVNSGSPFHYFTLSAYSQLLTAMEYYLRKKAEAEERARNLHDQ